MFGRLLAGTLYKYNGIFPGETFIVRRSLGLSYIGSITAQRSSSMGVSQTLRRDTTNGITEFLMLVIFNTGRQVYIPRAAIMLDIGPHSTYY